VTRVIAPPYVLLSEVHDADDAAYRYVRELIALDEGATRDADLTPGP
jgi:hypothetical protein